MIVLIAAIKVFCGKLARRNNDVYWTECMKSIYLMRTQQHRPAFHCHPRPSLVYISRCIFSNKKSDEALLFDTAGFLLSKDRNNAAACCTELSPRVSLS